MSYIRHTVIVLTSWNREHLARAYNAANGLFSISPSGMYGGFMNGYMSFFIPPEGCNIGSESQLEFSERRNNFLKWLRNENLYIDWIKISYGSELDGSGARFGEIDDGGYFVDYETGDDK